MRSRYPAGRNAATSLVQRHSLRTSGPSLQARPRPQDQPPALDRTGYLLPRATTHSAAMHRRCARPPRGFFRDLHGTARATRGSLHGRPRFRTALRSAIWRTGWTRRLSGPVLRGHEINDVVVPMLGRHKPFLLGFAAQNDFGFKWAIRHKPRILKQIPRRLQRPARSDRAKQTSQREECHHIAPPLPTLVLPEQLSEDRSVCLP